ncbi:MAG: PAS domain S-box protein [Sulfuricella sp.]|nr:PAS domain S-box protein [Sulfuricella sp.]
MSIPDTPPAKPARFWAMPNISVGLFILAVGAFLFYNHHQELDQRRMGLIEDLLWQEQSIRQHLENAQESLTILAAEMTVQNPAAPRFQNRAALLLNIYPEILDIYLVDEERNVQWHANPDMDTENPPGLDEEFFNRARQMSRTVFSPPQDKAVGGSWFEIHVPLAKNRIFRGVLVARISLPRILKHMVPWWYAERYQLSIVDGDGRILASKLDITLDKQEQSYQLSFDPPGYGLILRATTHGQASTRTPRILEILILGLSLLVIWSLGSLRKHLRHIEAAEQALRGEYAFRTAMENSMATGMRAVDMDGRIIYVNPAFSRMIGWNEAELVGRVPPMPYWPEDQEHRGEVFDAMLHGAAPREGSERPLRKKNGETLDVLIQSAPLIDATGRQKGWMSSITDITERKRTQEALAAAHERFAAVMEEINAAIVVTDAQTQALLYANSNFRRYFGPAAEAEDFCLLAPHYWQEVAQRTPRLPADVFDTEIQFNEQWFQVRGRVFKWVDGRTAHMEVATDITERKQADELFRKQEEKLQFTGRLVTMGEMASSLAHELNQPLTAIASYAAGSLNRLRNGENAADILPALETINNQAQRAGKIIKNIREFVKKSAPQKAPVPLAEILEESAGFADIEAKRHAVEIRLALEENLPRVNVDRIMIEQVILNLVRNGIEAIREDQEGILLLGARRSESGFVEVAVTDNGDGLKEEVARQLYTPFFSTKPDGMGMGLNICRSIIEFHHGRLWHEANPPGGTRFCFTLPAEEIS